MKDTLYRKPLANHDFQFDEKVAVVFEDMANRSIPGYGEICQGITSMVQNHALDRDSLTIYDLGCATGSLSLSLLTAIKKPIKLIAVDCSSAMLNRAKARIESFKQQHDIQFVEQSIESLEINKADVVILNFTLQFLSPQKRDDVVRAIYEALNDQALLILSEKTHVVVAEQQAQLQKLHLDFKRQMGYSELEISQKRQSLENIMQTETLEMHIERLQKAQFNHPVCWYYNRSFASFVAYK